MLLVNFLENYARMVLMIHCNRQKSNLMVSIPRHSDSDHLPHSISLCIFEELLYKKYFFINFTGTGSLGNGAAMRIAPVPLFCHNQNFEKVIEMTTQSAHITHTHKLGVNGAILQALAIHQLLPLTPSLESNTTFDVEKYIKELETKMATVESGQDDFGFEIEKSYQNQLKEVLRLLKADEPTDQEIVNVLGHNATALHSVPTAIFCFLKGQKKIKGIQVGESGRFYGACPTSTICC